MYLSPSSGILIPSAKPRRGPLFSLFLSFFLPLSIPQTSISYLQSCPPPLLSSRGKVILGPASTPLDSFPSSAFLFPANARASGVKELEKKRGFFFSLARAYSPRPPRNCLRIAHARSRLAKLKTRDRERERKVVPRLRRHP